MSKSFSVSINHGGWDSANKIKRKMEKECESLGKFIMQPEEGGSINISFNMAKKKTQTAKLKNQVLWFHVNCGTLPETNM